MKKSNNKLKDQLIVKDGIDNISGCDLVIMCCIFIWL